MTMARPMHFDKVVANNDTVSYFFSVCIVVNAVLYRNLLQHMGTMTQVLIDRIGILRKY